ncbi:hypothetical protein K457DRAFT_123003 [Linnemannia elongata AG-77]|uniref:Uncharacterized protein n=1 Tax=Linnemannia elongata AG-77 TaxID=1314771 RepID=A0A197K7Z1_9FUNG|nr:hypothetical protein K457DRAFT_123003 [Linnemannia elongata AG-77]
MMFKSSVTTFLLLAALATVSTAQVETTPTPTTATSTSTTTTSTVFGTPTITTTPTTRPPNNMTSVPDFSSLASVIASVATGRSLNPGYSPTAKPGAGANSASRMGGDVLTGMVFVVLSAVVAGAGTLAL